MSKFKVGDRVEAIWTNSGLYSVGDEGTVKGLGTKRTQVLFDHDQGSTTNIYSERIKLIQEIPMYTDIQIRDALKSCVTHWREIVGVFARERVAGYKATPKLGGEYCALCQLFGFNTTSGADCSICPLDTCGDTGSLYAGVVNATTNPEAYTASKAMLARLEELLAEYEAKVKDAEKRVTYSCGQRFDSPCGITYLIAARMLKGGGDAITLVNPKSGVAYTHDEVIVRNRRKITKDEFSAVTHGHTFTQVGDRPAAKGK